MSVIQKSSPLNLMGKVSRVRLVLIHSSKPTASTLILTSTFTVAIITSASTPLGAQTCRTLLRHNCLVLGIDETPIPESERLFSALGTHFQTLQLSLEDKDAVERIVEHSKERFWKQGLDILVTFGEGDGAINLRKEIGSIMADSGGGVISNVLDEGSVGQSADVVELSKSSEESGVRASIVILDGFAIGEGWTMLCAPEGAIEEVRECVDRFRGLTEEDLDTEKGNRGVADLLLYLGSELGSQINGAVVTADGGWRAL